MGFLIWQRLEENMYRVTEDRECGISEGRGCNASALRLSRGEEAVVRAN